ncbi:MAG TPA: PIN domain-containing protein [Thermoanaerobaculia bacterium]|nr:PIN domain-containing protein [Thermoanaerobaculia bacterium]
MTGEIFLDSGIFIAFLIRRDHQHAAAELLFADPPRHWCTSVLVIAETYSWFLYRYGEESARGFRSVLEEFSTLELLGAGSAHHEAVAKKLDILRGVKLTYVDASSLVWIAERKIRTVWGTDNHLAVEGSQVIPGPPDV